MRSSPALAALLVAGVAWLVGGDARATDEHMRPVLVFDAGVPGPTLPPAGRSLFDEVVASETGESLVPYPFAALIARIDAELQPASPQPPLKRLLIPLGRSLQRSAAAPRYFEFPRVVVAIDGGPRATSPLLLKDRLYLAYQERADQIEVISYNDAAGRFEFQLVRDYAAGHLARVVYANRALCTSCHQNGGPIFSRPTWDETSANPHIAARLRAQAGERFGVDLASGVDVADDFSESVHRANALGAAQMAWRDGCGDDASAAQRCRAALFRALVAFRLAGRTRPYFATSPLATLDATARMRWPHGLAIPEPDIPNRNPLESASPTTVEAAFDPLLPRPPSQVWSTRDGTIVTRAVEGLAEFVSDADIERLDQALIASRSSESAGRASIPAACEVRQAVTADSRTRIDFDCADRRDVPANVTIDAGVEVFDGRVDVVLRHVQWHRGAVLLDGTVSDARAEERGRVSGEPKRGRLAARDASGDAIERITFSWRGASGEIEIATVDDSARLDRAVDAMLRDGLDGRFDGFAAPTFRRGPLMTALVSRLAPNGPADCCGASARFAAPVADHVRSISTSADASLAPFYRHCATCHASDERAPANFLWGDAASVRERIAQCAPRIHARLSMWRGAFDAHAKTPMPPPTSLAQHGIAPDAWRESADLRAMIDHAATLAADRQPAATGFDALHYDALPSCLRPPGEGPLEAN